MRVWLIVQFLSLLCATAVAAGGGQFPGNTAHIIVYIKFVLFLVPVAGLVLKMVWQPMEAFRCDVWKCITENFLLLAFLFTLILSIPLSAYPVFSLQRCLYTYLGFGSLFCLLIQFHSAGDQGLLSLHCLQMLSLIMLTCIAIAWTLPLPGLRYNIQYAGLIHPNMLSSLLAQISLGLAFLSFTRLQSLFNRFLLIGLSVGILALQSRGVWIAVSVAAVTCLFADILLYKNKRSFLLLSTVGFALTITAITLLLVPDIMHAALVLVSRGQPLSDMFTLTNRIALWAVLFDNISLKQMLVGHGYALMSPAITVDFGTGLLYGAHSAYLSILLGTGILSLLLLITHWSVVAVHLLKSVQYVPKSYILLAIGSLTMLMTHAFVAEEFGLHLTPTFLLLMLYTQLAMTARNRP